MAAASRILIYALAALLCVLLTSETLLVSYSYKRRQNGPPSSKLLLISEALKLLIAGVLFLREGSLDDKHAGASGHSSTLPEFQKKTQDRGGWSACAEWMKAMLVFAVPAIIYFVNNNLVFYALRIMSVHTYTLMCDLKVITTGVLSYLVLDRHLNRQAAASLALLFAGITLGQLATVTADGGHTAVTGAGDATQAASWVYGVLLMTLVAILSALASVYTEWVMNHHSSYKHESINLQNMRLYASGTLLNGLFCVSTSGTTDVLTSFADMGLVHWAIVVVYAFMGLVTAVIIKRFGNIVKVYASCVASLCAAAASYALLHDPPAPLFYAGCLLVTAATLLLQQARSAPSAATQADAASSACGKYEQLSNSAGGRLRTAATFPAAAVFLVMLLLVLPAPNAGRPAAASI